MALQVSKHEILSFRGSVFTRSLLLFYRRRREIADFIVVLGQKDWGYFWGVSAGVEIPAIALSVLSPLTARGTVCARVTAGDLQPEVIFRFTAGWAEIRDAKLTTFSVLFPHLSGLAFSFHLRSQQARITWVSSALLSTPFFSLDHIRSPLLSFLLRFSIYNEHWYAQWSSHPSSTRRLFSSRLVYLFWRLSWFRWKCLCPESISHSVLLKLLSKSNLLLIPTSKNLLSISCSWWLSQQKIVTYPKLEPSCCKRWGNKPEVQMKKRFLETNIVCFQYSLWWLGRKQSSGFLDLQQYF